MKEFEAIVATRFLFGLGVALLLGSRLTDRQRRWIGWTSVIVGALSTPPFMFDVYANRAHD